MNVHVLQHVPFEGPGSIEDWCLANGDGLQITPLFSPDAVLPDAGAIDVLVIMGGPMNVYDDVLYPWLAAEKEFIRSFLQTKKPVLGICLGAQLLALCCGASVGRAEHLEIGWFPVEPTAAAEDFPWLFSLLEGRPMVFHWHGDRFEMPSGAVNLVTTKANDNQAFALDGGRVIGLQFHPEVGPVLLEQMVTEGREELLAAGSEADGDGRSAEAGRFVQSAETIISEATYREAGMLMRGVMNHLKGLVEQE